MKRIWLMGLLFFTGHALAKGFAPVPVWDVLGNTVPYQSPFPEDVKLWPDDVDPPVKSVKPVTFDEMIAQNLPIKLKLPNRRFERYQDQRAKHFVTPICVIGYDRLSQQWLSEHASALAQHGAVCLLAQAQALSEVKQLQEIAPGVVIQPVSAQKIVEQVGVPAYPALIFNGWVAQ